MLTHIGELGLQESDTLFQVRNLRLKDCYVARRVLSRCMKLCHVAVMSPPEFAFDALTLCATALRCVQTVLLRNLKGIDYWLRPYS